MAANRTSPAGSLEAALESLREQGVRLTLQRRAIMAAVLASDGHIRPADLARQIRLDFPEVSPSTVYRTIELLGSVGLLSHIHSEGGAEYLVGRGDGQIRLVCSRCEDETVAPLEEGAALVRVLKRNRGFNADLAHFAIAGMCETCARE